MTELTAIACGTFVGFTLGLIGGGGSIVATPMLLSLSACRRMRLWAPACR